MELGFFLLLALIVILGIVIIKIVNKVLTIATTIFFIFLLIVFLIGFLAYTDLRIVERDYRSSTSVFVFVSKGNITYAATSVGLDLSNSTSLSKQSVKKLQELYNEGNYDAMLENKFKLFILDEGKYGKNYREISKDIRGLEPVVIGIKEGKIQIYPDTIFFRVAKWLPAFVLRIIVV